MNPRLKTRREEIPLFEQAEAKARVAAREFAEARRDQGILRAAINAETRELDFHARALAHLEAFARSHSAFMAEDAREGFNFGTANPRAWGGVMNAGQARGIVVPDGYARANSSNRAMKVRWRSRIYSNPAGGTP